MFVKMKIFYCCLAVFLVNTQAAVDVEKTVQQVQSILKANSGLPRLTREEIIQLMNDIKAEDARNSASKESMEKTTTPNIIENEINSASQGNYYSKDINKQQPVFLPTPVPDFVERVTKRDEQKITVVLPYTPRDGSSLQELYTRPPTTEVVPVSKVTPKPIKIETSTENLQYTLNKNTKIPSKLEDNFPAELQAFLDYHGLTGKPGEDHFLLPLEGFKPLPPARIIDESVELPENILLTYDLISPSDLKSSNGKKSAASNFLYEPLRPELPFELDTSSSETKEVSLPYDMPKTRKTKSTNGTPNLEPIDYDSVKVIPLNKGVNPIDDINSFLAIEQSKRQTNSSSEVTTESTTTTTEEAKNSQTQATDSVSADTDTGPSIADLEDSFGGAAPSQPGDSQLPPPKKNGFYWMLDWNSFLEVGDGDTKVNIRFEPKFGDPQMFLPVTVP
ncbi:hypothetical protein K1T71_008141 [Dendrolimus kikuchii]|uniref:Uncharacterized protein n=1 Tax=Dendrolimus kikuchii TaxID=765133 RepID=A0ACC1CWH9_9NEOP|nr:hypothetical protein K1T71_008141 [Dendrolimus kikuchii]